MVLGGASNISNGSNSTVLGYQGLQSNITGSRNTIVGGYRNIIDNGIGAFIGAGHYNKNYGSYSVVCGGRSNKISAIANYAIITGGRSNYSVGENSQISGGADNYVGNRLAGIWGGIANNCSSAGSIIMGGRNQLTPSGSNYVGLICGDGNRKR